MSDLVWFIVIGVLFILLSLMFIGIGWQIWKKQKINLIMSYHTERVSEENKPAFCTYSGIGVFMIGIGFALSGICMFFLRSAYSFIPMAAGLVCGIVLLITAIGRYNH